MTFSLGLCYTSSSDKPLSLWSITYFLYLAIRDVFILIFLFPVKPERDAFDTLFDHAPDKLSVVKKVKKKEIKIQILFFTLAASYISGEVPREIWKWKKKILK